MMDETNKDNASLLIAHRWCAQYGPGWSCRTALGKGGTAPVFEVESPEGQRALKIYDKKFSEGEIGLIEQKRIEKQLSLKGHDCPYLVQIYEGGQFEGRHYLLMSRAPGTELEKRLKDVPRAKIRQIVDQVARAAIFLKERGLCHRDIKTANIFISDDFDHCTLLDISVIREIYDPIGVGTDHEGQLPVVATARYSPPEYLFRLLDSGPELWHALNVYQLGALLYDLIMKEPLFQNEYLKSAENRYRFAWIIARVDPILHADDIDQDLMFTAWRALDKDWQRRSTLTLEDFLADVNIRQKHALQVLGIGIEHGSIREKDNLTEQLQRIGEVAGFLEGAVVRYLREKGVTSLHRIDPGPHDRSKSIVFSWEPRAMTVPVPQQVTLKLDLQIIHSDNNSFGLSVTLTMQIDGKDIITNMALPDLQDEPEAVGTSLSRNAIDAFEKLALQITCRDTKAKEG